MISSPKIKLSNSISKTPGKFGSLEVIGKASRRLFGDDVQLEEDEGCQASPSVALRIWPPKPMDLPFEDQVNEW